MDMAFRIIMARLQIFESGQNIAIAFFVNGTTEDAGEAHACHSFGLTPSQTAQAEEEASSQGKHQSLQVLNHRSKPNNFREVTVG
jgi:hypothetical protein